MAVAGEGSVHPVFNVPGRSASDRFGRQGEETVHRISCHRGAMLQLHWEDVLCGGLVLACILVSTVGVLSADFHAPPVNTEWPSHQPLYCRDLTKGAILCCWFLADGYFGSGYFHTMWLKHTCSYAQLVLERYDICWGHQHPLLICWCDNSKLIVRTKHSRELPSQRQPVLETVWEWLMRKCELHSMTVHYAVHDTYQWNVEEQSNCAAPPSLKV